MSAGNQRVHPHLKSSILNVFGNTWLANSKDHFKAGFSTSCEFSTPALWETLSTVSWDCNSEKNFNIFNISDLYQQYTHCSVVWKGHGPLSPCSHHRSNCAFSVQCSGKCFWSWRPDQSSHITDWLYDLGIPVSSFAK